MRQPLVWVFIRKLLWTAVVVFWSAAPAVAGPVSRFNLTYQNATETPVQWGVDWAHEWTPPVIPPVEPPVVDDPPIVPVVKDPAEIPIFTGLVQSGTAASSTPVKKSTATNSPSSVDTPAAPAAPATSTPAVPVSPAAPTSTEPVSEPQDDNATPVISEPLTIVTPPVPIAQTLITNWPLLLLFTLVGLGVAGAAIYLNRGSGRWARAAVGSAFGILIIFMAYRQYRQPITADLASATDTGKYILWAGWGNPSMDYLENNPDTVRSFPFDGMMVGHNTFQTKPNDVTTSMTRSVFSTSRPFPDYSSLMTRWRNLTTETGALKHSLGYIYFKVENRQAFTDTTGWNQDLLPRWRKALEYLRSAGINGVFLDTENYDPAFSIWDITPTYEGLSDLGQNNVSLQSAMQDPVFAAKAQPFLDRANQYGREMVKIMKEVYGNEPVDLMVSHAGSGLSMFDKLGEDSSWHNDGTNPSAKPDKHYELAPFFMDGVVSEAAGSTVSFIDGMEHTYVYADTASGTSARKHRYAYDFAHSLDEIGRFSSNPNLYEENLKSSPAIWLDYGQSYPWYYQRTDGQWWNFQVAVSGSWFQGEAPGHTDAENFYSPQKFLLALRAALTVSDKYVWVYSQRPDMFGQYAGQAPVNGFTFNIPLSSAYSQALRNARRSSTVEPPTCSASLPNPPKIMEGYSTVLSPQVSATDPNGYAIPDNTRVVVEGDSISSGHGLAANQDWPSVLMTLPSFAGKGEKNNFARSGARVAELVGRYTDSVYPLRPTGDTKAILMAWAGTNDLLDGRSAAAVYADLQSYWQRAKSDGFEVWAFTTIARGSFSAAQNVELDALNQLIRDGGGWDRLIDIASVFTDASDASLYLDGIHPTIHGSKRIAWYIDDLSGPHTLVALSPTLPAGASVDAAGNIRWTPSADQVGTQTFTWRFGNGFAATACQTAVEVEPSQPAVTLGVVSDRNTLTDDQVVTYTMRATNNGNDIARNTKISVTMPERWAYVFATVPGSINGRVIELNLSDLAVGASAEAQLMLMPVR